MFIITVYATDGRTVVPVEIGKADTLVQAMRKADEMIAKSEHATTFTQPWTMLHGAYYREGKHFGYRITEK